MKVLARLYRQKADETKEKARERKAQNLLMGNELGVGQRFGYAAARSWLVMVVMALWTM